MDERFWASMAQREGDDVAFTVEACRALIENTRDIILLVRPSGEIALANAAAQRAYGLTRDELCAMRISDLRAPDTREAVPYQIDTAIESGILFETEHLHADGTVFPVEVSSRGVTICGELYALSVIRDISARRKRERERDRLLSDLEAANRQLDGLLRIVSGVVGRTEVGELLERTLHVLREVLEARGALLFLLDGDRWVLRRQAGYPEEDIVGFTMPADTGFASLIAEAGEALWIPDVTQSDVHVDAHDRYDIRTILGVPLYLEGELFGVLECTWSVERMTTEGERLMLQVAADRLMTAIGGARHFEGTRRSRDIEAALAEASASLASSHVLAEMMPEALGVMASALGCDGAAFGAYRSGRFEVQYGLGVEPGFVDVPDHQQRAASTATSPPVVRIGDGAHDGTWLREAWGWVEAIVTPVRVRGEWVGALLFGRTSPGGGFDERAEEALRRLSLVLSLAYANTRDFETEHRIAETLQEALLTIDTSVQGVEFARRYRSATMAARVGGDFYDVFSMPGGRVGTFVGDVSGKGLDAAVLTTLVKQTLRAFAHESTSPAQIISRTNSVLVSSSRMREFASVFLAVVDPFSGECTYCRAGHPPAYVVRSAGDVEPTESGGPVIGAFADIEFEEGQLALRPGDLLVLYTDGVTEARDPAGEFFGDERLVEMLQSATGETPEHVAGSIDAVVRQFAADRLSDDLAVVVVTLA